uniref:Uncharacterized protein n=1 Tax=Utricularia reniformis TaxID=192314 RepID=A0A1Y0B0B5_9LAMI|nr:hypothetical protein AEK19_MT0621 [Utricularia reniformis]ART30876.1 hypothetical protein AEK19_MT0621 [Utricularia reniformis]
MLRPAPGKSVMPSLTSPVGAAQQDLLSLHHPIVSVLIIR